MRNKIIFVTKLFLLVLVMCCFALFTVHIKGQWDSRVFEDRDVKFTMGEGIEAGIVPGVEMGIKKCRLGETAELVVKANYGYGADGNKSYNIPPDSDLVYEVVLKQLVRVSTVLVVVWKGFV